LKVELNTIKNVIKQTKLTETQNTFFQNTLTYIIINLINGEV